MAQPSEDKGFSEVFRETAERGLSFAPLQKLAARFGFASNDPRFKKSSLTSDQDILSKRSGYVVVDETSAQFDEAAQKREKEEEQKSGVSAIFENATTKSGSIFDAANDFFTMLAPMLRNPFSSLSK